MNLAKCLLAEANPCWFVLQQDKVESVKQLLACGKTCANFFCFSSWRAICKTNS